MMEKAEVLTEYEQQRAAKIARNEQVLQGDGDPGSSPEPQQQVPEAQDEAAIEEGSRLCACQAVPQIAAESARICAGYSRTHQV